MENKLQELTKKLYDEGLEKLRERNRLDIVVAEPGWATTQPTEDLYSRCKSFLDSAHRGA